jgi:hypothetical protein
MNSMGNGQGMYCHELGCFVRVPQSCARVSKIALWLQIQTRYTSDNRGHEQRDRIQWSVNANRDEHVHPDLPVFERVEHVLGVVLVCERGAVLRQPMRHFGLLLCCQEFRSRWVVVHNEEGDHRCFKCQQSLWPGRLSQHLPTMNVIRPSRMKIQAHPSRPPIPSISVIPRASRPPNAPAAVAAEKKIAMRNPHSCLRYHNVI